MSFFAIGTTIFEATGISNSYITQIILGTVNVACTFPGLYFIERFGRRKCLTVGGAWMCMCFIVFASVGHFALDRQSPTNTPQAGAAMIVFACLFIAAFASTWGPMVWAGRQLSAPKLLHSISLMNNSDWGTFSVPIPCHLYGSYYRHKLDLRKFQGPATLVV